MPGLDEINQEVQRRAASAHDAVLFGVFENLKKEHLKGSAECDCEYCRLLHQYVMIKLFRHRLNRRRYRDFPGVPIEDLDRRLDESLPMLRRAQLRKNMAKEIL